MKEEIVEKIEKDIKEKKKMPREVQEKINKRIFTNILIACFIFIYFIFINLGFNNIEADAFLIDLKVFSMAILFTAILLFEKSYNKDDGIICIYGIETLVLAIITLISTYFFILMKDKFILLISLVSYFYGIYYVAKSIIIYKKMKNEYIKSLNDISEIVKEEKPVKIKETTKKRKIDREENKDIKQENKKASSNVIQNKKTNNMKKTKKVNKNIDKK